MSFIKAISVLAALVGGMAAGVAQDGGKPKTFENTESVSTLLAKTDWTCILRTWRLKGVMICVVAGQTRTCLWVQNAYPCGILEVVRSAGKTHIAEAATAIKGLEGMSLSKFGSSSSHTTSSDSGAALQFTEGRVYTYVPPLVDDLSDIPIAKPTGPLFSVNYVTELDGFGWRTGIPDILADPLPAVAQLALPACANTPEPARCAGRWGPYRPRIGFAQLSSEVIAAYLLALRAGRVAAMPGPRVVVSPYSFEPRTGHYIQMVRPALRVCAVIGAPLVRPLEGGGALSREGAYLFIHFGLFETCRGCLPTVLVGPRSPTGN